MCPIMPQRLAGTDPFTQVTEMVGSGPYRYKADERVPGDRVIYERNAAYVPRSDGTADGTAGRKVAHFDRVEWRIIPDPATVAAAMQQQEVDWWLSPDTDLLPLLRRQPHITVESVSPTGFIATMRFNQLHPPFDNPAIRRAIVGAVSQADYMIGMVGTDPALWRNQVGYFCPNTPMASSAGMEALTSPRDLDAARKALADAGYNGETVVVLTPTDIASAKALAEITADLLRKLGMAVEATGDGLGDAGAASGEDRSGGAGRLEHLPHQLGRPGHDQSRRPHFSARQWQGGRAGMARQPGGSRRCATNGSPRRTCRPSNPSPAASSCRHLPTFPTSRSGSISRLPPTNRT